MGPIDSLNQIMRILRRQLSEKIQHKSKNTATNSLFGSDAAENKIKPSLQELQQKIHNRIDALEETEKKGPKAISIFIESILLWEFGDRLIEDSQFTELTERLRHIMTEDPLIYNKIQTFLGDL